MTENTTTTPLERAIQEVAASRGIGSIEELVEQVKDAGGDLTVEELHDWPRGGYGDELDKVLHTNEDERWRIVDGWVATFMSGLPAKPSGENRARPGETSVGGVG